MYNIRIYERMSMSEREYKDIEPADEGANRRRIEKCIELAAMFKEIGKGNWKLRNKILAKFRLQEGATKPKAIGYFNDLVDAGIIVISKGKKRWRYNKDAEWDEFSIDI